jgi:uncharacterized OB-fold protein
MRPLPIPERDSKPWWEALTRHELTLQRCSACSRLRWPARAICNRCGSFEWEWTAASGRGRVVTWLVNHHSFGGAFETPSTVVSVRLADQEDILIPARYEGPPDGRGLDFDLPMEIGFDDVTRDDGASATLLHWRVASG